VPADCGKIAHDRHPKGSCLVGLVRYRLPATGELVPLLAIAPSKTDAERLLVISPELADVLSAIITRIRRPDGTVSLAAAYG
jgi:hypothetical protein